MPFYNSLSSVLEKGFKLVLLHHAYHNTIDYPKECHGSHNQKPWLGHIKFLLFGYLHLVLVRDYLEMYKLLYSVTSFLKTKFFRSQCLLHTNFGLVYYSSLFLMSVSKLLTMKSVNRAVLPLCKSISQL
jgi:hypothetical protein